MKQQAFEDRYQERWQQFEKQLKMLENARELNLSTARTRDRASRSADTESSEFPKRYREICRDLSIAIQRCYSPALQDRLNFLASGGHRQLYSRDTAFATAFVRFVTYDFPATFRKEAVFMTLSAALFVLSALAIFALVLSSPEMIYSVLSPERAGEFESMYDPGKDRIGTNREPGEDVYMFGFYIMNNIGVGFRTFASGIAGGLGSAFFLIFNGVMLGGVAAHMLELGYDQTFFSFVIGHSSFELTAIVITGGAGLKIGDALIAPGRHRRVDRLRLAAIECMPLIYGSIAMLVAAAIVEAFWSSKASVAAELKFTVGAVLWMAVFLYFSLAGRQRHATR